MPSPAKFYQKTPAQRLAEVAKKTGLSLREQKALANWGALGKEKATGMVENAVGGYTLPLGIATHFVINGRKTLVPMAIEESSVIAAASHGAKLAGDAGGFSVTSTPPIAIGQVHLLCPDPAGAASRVRRHAPKLLALANRQDPVLARHGGGARALQTRCLKTAAGPALVVHLLVDTRDAMGANAVNTMCEALAPELEALSGGTARLKILSNLAIHRTATARAVFTQKALGGEEAVDAVLEAWQLADADPYRAVTLNKGIMNGVDAVALATGNDWRALEAGAHAFASLSGRYRPLTQYHKNQAGDLEGMLTLPVAVGTVGGATRAHPTARAALKVLGVQSARQLGEVLAAVGLAQNLAALRALATEGIQKGHMKLHAYNLALQAGAPARLARAIAREMTAKGTVREDVARALLQRKRGMQA